MKEQISVKKLRHRAEVPMIWLLSILTVLMYIMIIASVTIYDIELAEWVLPIAAGIVVPVFALIYVIREYYWKTIASGVEITEHQFPEIYEQYISIAQDMGFGQGKGIMAAVPRLYLANGNGSMNAFASKCQLHKGYVTIYSDILDIAYVHGDFDGVRFILAHELGHIKCGHVNLWRLIIRPIGTVLFLENSLTRAQEWTADRCAYYYAPEGKRSMISLFAGKNLYQRVDFDEYIKSVNNHKDGFWLKFTNFMANHAIGFRRMEAIRQTEEKGWDVHGKML